MESEPTANVVVNTKPVAPVATVVDDDDAMSYFEKLAEDG
jgi:hypothetical protein